MKKLTALTIILWASFAHAENYVPTDAYGNSAYSYDHEPPFLSS